MTTQEMSSLLVRREAERHALQAILASQTFQKRTRLAKLLEYICERYFEGETDSIKEYSIATDVFDRPTSFDQTTDSIVRVEVFRLRKRLREYYEGEGADQTIEIVVATGHYRPQFVDRSPCPEVTEGDCGELSSPQHENHDRPAIVPELDASYLEAKDYPAADDPFDSHTNSEISGPQNPSPDVPTPEPSLPSRRTGILRQGIIGLSALICVACLSVFLIHMGRAHLGQRSSKPAVQASVPSSPALVASGPELRIRCGYNRPSYKDGEGNVWLGDRYFSGGYMTELPMQHIARTRNPELYLTARTGIFSYKIPLTPGIYELHLHFAETTYSPSSTLGGGENSRVFNVALNGRPLLPQFDIVSDAGASTADERVFRDVQPAADGYLHLDFTSAISLPMINAIEILPGLPHRIHSVRMVAQNTFFTDKSGNLWMPDTYASSGQLAYDKVTVTGTNEPGLYAGERYGNFNYAVPVDEGSYSVTLYFSEKYWGSDASDVSRNGGIGSRVLSVFCNGVALYRRLDILKEVGAGKALVRTWHGLHPNAQGKLIISFVPDVNYASVDAIEVEQEKGDQ